MNFLTADWQNLALINYNIDPNILLPFIPNGTELDLQNNICYISVVGFLFKNTKLLGLPIPFHRNFEEVNLRFYVKRKEGNVWKRGVVFIKELVPKPALTFIANTIYKEHYETVKMNHNIINTQETNTYTYKWKIKNNWQHIILETGKDSIDILPNTEAYFITEHYYGYTKKESTTYEYEVTHPTWKQLLVKNWNVNIDFKLNYGEAFECLNKQKPTSVILAKGSKITVKNKVKIL